MSKNEVMDTSLILYSYLHGEIYKMISGRFTEVDLGEFIQTVKSNFDKLMWLLFEKIENIDENKPTN